MSNYTQHKHYRAAYNAYRNMSFDPDKRAESECAFYDEICAEFADRPDALARFERLFLASLAAKSRCASAMIVGPARFPVDRNRKAMDRERKVSDQLLEYVKRLRNPRSERVHVNALDEARAQLAALREKQELMKAVNKAVRVKPVNMATLIAIFGDEERAKEALKPNCFGRIGFESFELTNNNAKLKTAESRVAFLERQQSPETQEAQESNVNGVRVVKNTEYDRLQLFFGGKPPVETIQALKGNGFRWAPSNGSWQRQLTPNALHAAGRVLGQHVQS